MRKVQTINKAPPQPLAVLLTSPCIHIKAFEAESSNVYYGGAQPLIVEYAVSLLMRPMRHAWNCH